MAHPLHTGPTMTKSTGCLLGVLGAAACAASEVPPHAEVTGPVYRFAIDRVDLPESRAEANAFAADLLDDGGRDNAAGYAFSLVAWAGKVINEHRPDLIAAGTVASSIEIQADDLQNDDSVFVWYRGADGATAQPVFGALIDGTFTSEAEAVRTRPGTAALVLPAFADADPVVVEARLLRLELVPDVTGYTIAVHGAFEPDALVRATATSLAQMVAARPADHPVFVRLVDATRTFDLSADGIAASSFVRSLLAPDLDLEADDSEFAEPDAVSIGFRVHATPCDAGRCTEPAAPTCFDRVLNGSETDRDCGGDCAPCAGGLTCARPSDCQELACNGFVCAAPSCSDGRTNGFESDIDCGYDCEACGRDATCVTPEDCDRGECDSYTCR